MNETDTVATITTLEQDRQTAAHNINLIWEYTQAVIAVVVVLATLLGVFFLSATNELLANAFFLIVGFYFGRTNHARGGEVTK